MALRLETLAEQYTDGDGSGVVDLGRGDGLGLVPPQFLVVTEGAEGDDRDVDVTFGERFLDDGGMAVEVGRVEVDDADLAGSGAFELRLRLLEVRGVLPRGEGDRGRAGGEELGGDGDADLRGAAEQQDVLGLAHSIEHVVFYFLIVVVWGSV